MGTDDDCSGLQAGKVLENPDPHLFQLVDHLWRMDYGAKRKRLATPVRRFESHLRCTLHTETETGLFRQYYLHYNVSPGPDPCKRSSITCTIPSTTSPMESEVESTTMASSACFRGA